MAINGTIPVYGGNGIAGYHDKANIFEKSIVIGRVGFYCGCVHLTQEKAWITDNAFIVTYPKINISQDFLILILNIVNQNKSDIQSTPLPTFRYLKRYFVSNVFGFKSYLLIMAIISSFEDVAFLLVFLYFPLFYELLFFCFYFF